MAIALNFISAYKGILKNLSITAYVILPIFDFMNAAILSQDEATLSQDAKLISEYIFIL